MGKWTSEQVNKWTSEQVDCKERQSNKGNRQGNELIAKEDKVTGEQGVKAYCIWGEKGLKKARD